MSNKRYSDNIKKLMSYSDQDYDSIMTSTIDSIPELTPEYNDVSETDMGMVILEENAKMADVLSWKADVTMNEALPGNARSRKAALIHSKWLSYKVKQNIASTATQKFVIMNDGNENPVVIPKGTKVATSQDNDAIVFELSDTVVATPPVDVLVDQTYDVFATVVNGISTEEYLGLSNGRPNQTFLTSKTPCIHHSMVLEVLDPATNIISIYTESDYLFDIKNDENKFVVQFDEYGNGHVQFGDGVNGNIPAENSDILAKYRLGGGSKTNVSLGMLNVILDVVDERVVSSTNATEAYGGEDEESVSSINANAPNVFKTRNRLVTNEDCVIWGRAQVGVDDACFQKDTSYIDVYNLYLLPTSRNLVGLPDERKTELKKEIDRLCMLGDDIRIQDPVYKDVEISVEVICDQLYDAVNVESGVFNEIKTMMEAKMFNETLSVSDILDIRKDVDGVFKLRVTKLCVKGGTGVADIDCVANTVVRLEYDEDVVITIVS